MISWPPHTIWLNTPKGVFRVLFIVDRGPDSDIEWNVVMDDGKVWAFQNPHVTVANNHTYGVGENKKTLLETYNL